MKKLITILLIVLMTSSLFFMFPARADEDKLCEQCGMTVDATGQARFRIVDAAANEHVACCPVCALKMLKTYKDLNITSFCDYGGPGYPINIVAKDYGSEVAVTPSSALIIVGGSCTKNRIVYDNAAADNLLASPNNGTSKWLSPLTNATVLPNATRLGVAQAALQYGGGTTSPSPSPTTTVAPTQTPNPTQQPANTATPRPSTSTSSSPAPSQSPTATPSVTASAAPTNTPSPTDAPQQAQNVPDQVCEPCGMVVTADDQWHFKVTDGTGQIHYVECFMCALNLVKRYETLHIETFCDWYGPDRLITIDSTGFGAQVNVSPSTAMYLYTGSCENNRVAYDQNAANLLKNGYSQHTSLFQQHDWAFTPTVVTVSEGVNMYNEMSPSEGSNKTIVWVLLGGVVAAASVGGVVVFWRFKHKKA